MNDTPEPIAWAVYGGKTGLLRYVVSDEENVRQLVDEGGYVARPLFEHPSPTAPADDVRETLERHLREAVRMGIGWPKANYLDRWIAERVDTMVAEVRPRGTVTDAEVEAAARAMSPRADRWADFSGVARTALEAAREARS